MANINMISGLRAETLRLRRTARSLFYAVALVLVAMLGTFLFTSAGIARARGEIDRIDSTLSGLRPKIERIKDMEVRRVTLRPKISTLEEAQVSTMTWFGVMDGLRRSVPSEVWLTNLAVETGKENARVLKLNGVALSNRVVGETMQRLNSQLAALDDFVTLRYVQPATGGLAEAVEFELAAALDKPSEEVKDEAHTK